MKDSELILALEAILAKVDKSLKPSSKAGIFVKFINLIELVLSQNNIEITEKIKKDLIEAFEKEFT